MCADAYTRGQEERLAGRSFSARSQFQACADSGCPNAIVRDCRQWASEVEASLPTIIVHAEDAAGQRIANAVVFLDGVRVPAAALAQPVVVDVGSHNLRFDAPGYESVQLNPSLRAEDRGLAVTAVLRSTRPPPRLDGAMVASSARPAAGSPSVAFVLAGVGALALGGSIYFGVKAKSDYDDLQRECAPHCAQSRADAVHTKAVIADAALATAVVAVGAAAWLYFGRARDPSSATALGLEAQREGARARLRVTF